jgi:hypothetical protein
MPTHYTLTYTDETRHEVCTSNANNVTFSLIGDGVVEYFDGSASREVHLITIYHTKDGSNYPSPPEDFAIFLTYTNGHAVLPIGSDQSTLSIAAVDNERGRWTLTVPGPTNDDIANFQLASNCRTPPQKLEIRVKRQPAFSCNPFDDEPGAVFCESE